MPPHRPTPETLPISPSLRPRTVVPAPEAPRRIGMGRRALHVIGLTLALPACVPGPEAEPDAMEALPRASVDILLPGSDVTAFSVSYLRGGPENGPRVIYVHGTPGAADGWADFLMDPPVGKAGAQPLAYDAIAIDRPGFGESGPKSGAVTSLEAQAAALLPFLEDKSGIRPVLVGHSLGGPVVVQAAVSYPDKVGGLVITAGSLDPDLEDIHPMQWVGEWMVIRSVLPRAIRNANKEIIALEAELRRLQPSLGDIALPIVIVHGTQDNLVPFANVAFMEKHLTGTADLEIVVLEGVNHFLPWNSKSAIDSAVARVFTLMQADDEPPAAP